MKLKFFKTIALTSCFIFNCLFSMEETATDAASLSSSSDVVHLTQNLEGESNNESHPHHSNMANTDFTLLKEGLEKSLKDRKRMCGIPECLKKYSRNIMNWFYVWYNRNNNQYGQTLTINDLTPILQTITQTPTETKEKKSKFTPKTPTKAFVDLGGEISWDIQDTVNFAKTITAQNGTVQEKILLYGPPGTGKSSLAEAIAGELGWDFFNVISSALVTKYRGSSQELISDLFESAGKSQRGAIIFIDELDGIANVRSAESSDEMSRAIASLHNEIDSLKVNKKNIICIVATNFLDRIPQTIKSRFGTNLIGINIPEVNKRTIIFNNVLHRYPLGNNFIKLLAELSEKFSCRDLDNLISKAKAMAPDLFIQNTQFNHQTISQMRDILKVALYKVKDKIIASPRDLKVVLKNYLKKILPSKTAAELDNFIENDANNIIAAFNGLTGTEIEKCVIIANSLQRGELTESDLFVSVFYDNASKLPDDEQRKRILDYFLKKDDVELGNLFLDIIAKDLAAFSGKDIRELCLLRKEYMRHNFSGSITRQTVIPLGISKFMGALGQILENKAIKHKIIEHYNKNTQYLPRCTFNGGLGGGAIPANASLSYNFGFTNIDFPGFTIQRISIEDEVKHEDSSLISNNEIKTMREDMLNTKIPSCYLIVGLMVYNLALNKMNIDESVINLLKSRYLFKLVTQAFVSCFTVTRIIKSVINYAKGNNRNICIESDLLKTFKELNFNIKGYEVLPMPDRSSDQYTEYVTIFRSFIAAQPRHTSSSYCAIQ